MTLLLLESFDMINTAALSVKGWAPASGATVTSGGRTGQCLSVASSGGAEYAAHQVQPAQDHATMTCGFAFLATAYNTGGEAAIASFWADNDTTQHVTLAVSPAGVLSAYRGSSSGTLLGSGGYVPLNTWVYIELEVTLSASVGVVKVNLNNATVINLTGQNTKNGGTATVLDTFRAGFDATSTTATFKYDDLYLTNGAGSINTAMLGDTTVQVLRPDGNGSQSQLTNDNGNSTNNYSHVNSTLTQSATYVEAGTAGLEDLYDVSALPMSTGTVVGVQVVMYASKSDAGARSVIPLINISGTDYTGSTDSLGTGLEYYQQVFEQNPATSSPWAIADVNGAQYGVRVE